MRGTVRKEKPMSDSLNGIYIDAEEIVEERKRVLKATFEAHPERFVKDLPLPPENELHIRNIKLCYCF